MKETKSFSDFHAFLETEINSYRGKVKDYIYCLPALFKALCGALDQRELSPAERMAVLCALGYLVAPNDIVPEVVYGPAGYADDVFVCALVLDRLVKTHGAGFVEPYWERETDPVEEVLAQVLEETRGDLREKVDVVLGFTGLGS